MSTSPTDGSGATRSLREHRCYGADLPQHDDRCYCGRPATRHIFYGSGCGNVCGIHARSILRKKGIQILPRNCQDAAMTLIPSGTTEPQNTSAVARDRPGFRVGSLPR